jgi:hypothetical protein
MGMKDIILIEETWQLCYSMKRSTKKDHENETMKVKLVFKSYGKTYKWFSAYLS